MSFDGILTHAIKDELSTTIESGKISKIYQLNQYELLFTIRGNSKNSHLLLSAHPSYSRVHLTKAEYDKPFEPPMFCMLLRKHLEGGIVEKVEQVEFERILVFHIRSRNELGDVTYKKLIVEIMNKHSNIIVVDRDTNKIIDSIKHLSPALNRHRTVMPGSEYIEPPKQNKVDPLLANEEDVLKKVDFNSGKLAMQLVENFAGLSPLIANEIVHRAGLANATSLPRAFSEMMGEIKEKKYEPQILFSENGKELFYVLPLTHIKGEKKTFTSVSEMLDRFYGGKAERDRVKQQASDLERFIKNEWNKNKRKIKKLQKTIKDAEKAEQYKLHGELLTAHMYMVKRGDSKITVANFYDEAGEDVTITLDPQKTASQNAQNYFKKYQKAKTSLLEVEKQLILTNEEITYFDGLLQQVESASLKDILEIREELIEGGYLKKSKSTKKKAKQSKPNLEKYISTDGFEILVGKNNKQNDYLTNRIAHQDDLWFHTKDIPGSHVVIKGKDFTEQTILEAANIAAFFSKARQSSSVPVDFTKIRHVKKPSGAKPGYVIYDNQQTVYVTPSEDLILKLKG
jgi:predicted ribosome quality control (RQC) complex YloA/Tae2 family protein